MQWKSKLFYNKYPYEIFLDIPITHPNTFYSDSDELTYEFLFRDISQKIHGTFNLKIQRAEEDLSFNGIDIEAKIIERTTSLSFNFSK